MEAIKCEMCGSYELEETDSGYICKHCHTIYKKDADEEDDYDDLYLKEQMKKGKVHLDLGNFDLAEEIFEDILEEYPQEAGAYIYYTCAATYGFRDYSENSIKLAKECKRKFEQVKKKGKDYPLLGKFDLYQELVEAFLAYEKAKLDYYGESMGLDTLKLRKYGALSAVILSIFFSCITLGLALLFPEFTTWPFLLAMGVILIFVSWLYIRNSKKYKAKCDKLAAMTKEREDEKDKYTDAAKEVKVGYYEGD